jgi:hypothetical protein
MDVRGVREEAAMRYRANGGARRTETRYWCEPVALPDAAV